MHRIISPLQCSYLLPCQWILAFSSDIAGHSLVPRVARQGLCPVLGVLAGITVTLMLRQLFLTTCLSSLLLLHNELCASSCCPPTASCFPYLCFLRPFLLNVSSALLDGQFSTVVLLQRVSQLQRRKSTYPASCLEDFHLLLAHCELHYLLTLANTFDQNNSSLMSSLHITKITKIFHY